MRAGRDPVEEWRDVSRRAALATGYRPRSRAVARPAARLAVGGAAALVLVLVVGGLALRSPTTITGPAGPVAASAEDASFRLDLTTPQATYGPEDAIEPVARMTYLGPRAAETIFHAAYPIGFRIEEVGGVRLMGGGMDQPCLSTELGKGESAVLPFAKAGSPDDPKSGFDRAWYEDPVLRLPEGTWRIVADLDVFLGDCGGERHQLTVENIVRVAASDVASDAPTATPSPSLSADAATALEIVRKYEDAIATDHPEDAWPMLSPWSRTTVGSSTTFVDAERRARDGDRSTVQIADPSRHPVFLDAAILGERAADLAATADPNRTYVVSVGRPGSDAEPASTVNLVVAPLLGGDWRIWLDTTPGTYGAWPYPEGCAAFGLSPRRCEAVVAAAASNVGFDRSTATATSLMAEPGCGMDDPSSDVINMCTRTTSFVAGVRFEVAETVTRTDVFCGLGPPTLVCSESPGLEAIDLHNAGFWDVPCSGEAPAGCATPLPPPTGAAAAAGRELRIDTLDVPVGPVGHREVDIGTAVLPNGILTEATFRISDESQVGFLIDPGIVRMELRSSEPGRPAFDNIYARGASDGPEEVRIFLVFDVVETGPDATVRIADVIVR
jgi:hypothetical protein